MKRHRNHDGRNAAAGPSQRQLRVGEQLRHVIAETMQRGRFHDEALLESGSITVTEVRPSPDLRHASVYVLTLGGQDMSEILPALNQAAPYFQSRINGKLDLRFTPRLRFIEDTSFAEGSRMDALLDSLPKPRIHDDQDEEKD